MQKVFNAKANTANDDDIDPIVRLTENPDLADLDTNNLFPGRIGLDDHDGIHILTSRGQKMSDEAWTIAVTMGSTGDMDTHKIGAYLYMAQNFYGDNYKFSPQQALNFWYATQVGDHLAKTEGLNDLSQFKTNENQNKSIATIREEQNIPHDLYLWTREATEVFRSCQEIQGLTTSVNPELHEQVSAAIESQNYEEVLSLLEKAEFKFLDTDETPVDLEALKSTTNLKCHSS